MKYLVTGGTGFIGSHLVERFLNEGQEATILDDLSTGRIENIEAFRTNPQLRLVTGSVTNDEDIQRIVAGHDAIFHLASPVGMRLAVTEPVESMEVIAIGTSRVLKYAAEAGVPVLVASSCEVYGRNDRMPLKENMEISFPDPTAVRWAYGTSQLFQENLALAYVRQKGAKVVVARLFNIVGPRQLGYYGMVLPRFIDQALTGGPITVYGDGNQTRCFCHVSELNEAMIRLVNNEAAFGEVVNIGSTDEITIRDLARQVRDIVNNDAAIEYIPYTNAYGEGFEEVSRRVPDLSKLKSLIDFIPTMSIEDIIKSIFKQRQQMQAK